MLSDSLDLKPFVPPLVAQGWAATPGRPWLSRFPGVVIFADLSGFTAMAEQLSLKGAEGAEELARSLDSFFEGLFEVIADFGGQVIKIAGDAPFVVWKAEGDLASTVALAARCALAMSKHTLGPSSLRIGLGAGEVVLASVGGLRDRWEFFLAGHPLAQVAQAERLAEPSQVVVSPEARLHLGPDYTFEGPVLVDGPEQATRHGSAYGDHRLSRGYVDGGVLSRLEAGQADWLAELRRISVMFIRFEGLEYESGLALARVQQAVFTVQCCLYRYGGNLNQFLVDDKGTVLVAALGVPPDSHEDDEARAAMAAMELLQGLREIGIGCGVGISTGLVFCGTRGSRHRREACLIGDRVNAAARLMQAAKDCVLCDGATTERARFRVEFEDLPPLSVKGKSQPMEVSRALCKASLANLTSPELVGREQSLAQLLEWFSEAPRLVTLVGPPGMGKSTLLGALLRLLEAEGFEVVRGVADPLDQREAFSAWRGLLRQILGSLDPAVWLEEQGEASHLPLLGELLGQDLGQTTLEGAGRWQTLRWLAARLLVWWLTGNPYRLLVLDDAHLMDASSAALLADLEGQRVLLVGRELPSYGSSVLTLGPLGENEIAALVARRAGASSCSTAVARRVLEVSEGNPLVADQMALTLLQEGAVVVVQGQVRAGEKLVTSMPVGTLAGLVTSRVDRLPPAQNLILKVASVLGRRFLVPLLGDILPAASGLSESLQELEKQELAFAEPDDCYRFQHALTREVVYQTLLFAQRRQAHRQVADWHELHQPEAWQVLSHHWALAGEESTAASYDARAGFASLRQGAYIEAMASLGPALERWTGASTLDQARLHRALGEALYAIGRLQECDQHMHRCLELLGRPLPRSKHAWTRSLDGWLYPLLVAMTYLPGRLGKAVIGWMDKEAVRSLVEPTRKARCRPRSEDPVERESVLAVERLAMLQAYTGTLAQSFLYGGELGRRAELLGPGPELARAYAMNAAGCSSVFPLQRMGQFYREQAEELAAEIGDDSLNSWVSYATSVQRGVIGDWDGYFGALQRAADLSELTGNVRQAAECRTIMAQHQLWLGRVAPARATLETLLAVPHGTIDPQHRCWALSGLGLAALLQGRWNDATRDLEQARAELVERDKIAVVNLHGYFALAASLVGDKERAIREASLVLGQLASVPSAFWVRGGVFMATYACCRMDSPLARTGANYLSRFAHHFVTCEPAANLCQGMLGKANALVAAVESSQRLFMPMEGGLALYELGRGPEAQAVLSDLPGLWR